MTHIHLWIGVSAAALVIVISVTGIMLNHKQLFGFQPDPPGAARTGLAEALPMLLKKIEMTRTCLPSSRRSKRITAS